MLHPVFALTLIDEAVGVVSDVLIRLTVRPQLEPAEQVARGRPHDVLHVLDGLLDPIGAVLENEAVVGAADDRQVACAREHQPQYLGFISLHRKIQEGPLLTRFTGSGQRPPESAGNGDEVSGLDEDPL